MAIKYADRAFISVQGVRYADVQQASIRRNFNARPVKTMTRDGQNRGFVRGNVEYVINLVKPVEDLRAREKIEALDFEGSDVSVTLVFGADQYIAKGLFPMDAEDSAPGVGEEVKFTINFGALQLTDAVGNPVDFVIP